MPGEPVRHRASNSKRVEDSHRRPALWAGHSRNDCKAVSEEAHPQGVEGLGLAGSGETIGVRGYPLPYGPVYGPVYESSSVIRLFFQETLMESEVMELMAVEPEAETAMATAKMHSSANRPPMPEN
jgi:hypothetical protein